MLSSQNNDRDDVTWYIGLTLNNCIVSSPCVVPSDCTQTRCTHMNPPIVIILSSFSFLFVDKEGQGYLPYHEYVQLGLHSTLFGGRVLVPGRQPG